MTIKTDNVNVEHGADFTFVCRKIPFAVSCSDLHQGNTNLIDLDLVNKMKIPVRNIKVTRMSLLGHDVRSVGRIKQTVQCVVNGRVQGCVHLEGRVVRDLFSTLNVDCLAGTKTYERLMGRKPPDPSDEGYESTATEDIPTLGGEDEESDDNKEQRKEENENSVYREDLTDKEEVPPGPRNGSQPPPSLQIIKSDNPNLCIIETECKKIDSVHSNLYEEYAKYGPGPRDLLEAQMNSISMTDERDDEDENITHCELCFREGKPIRIVSNHEDRCPTCPSLTPTQKVRMFGPYWKEQAKLIIETRYKREKESRT